MRNEYKHFEGDQIIEIAEGLIKYCFIRNFTSYVNLQYSYFVPVIPCTSKSLGYYSSLILFTITVIPLMSLEGVQESVWHWKF